MPGRAFEITLSRNILCCEPPALKGWNISLVLQLKFLHPPYE
jgi:hypothetical protein